MSTVIFGFCEVAIGNFFVAFLAWQPADLHAITTLVMPLPAAS